jgi:hypothetical protein
VVAAPGSRASTSILVTANIYTIQQELQDDHTIIREQLPRKITFRSGSLHFNTYFWIARPFY